MASSQGTARSGGTARAPADMARKNMRPGRPDVISTGTMQDPALTAAFRDWPAAVTGCALLATTRDAPTAFSANSAARTHPGAPWPISALADFLHGDRKSTRLNSSHLGISYAVFCLKKK